MIDIQMNMFCISIFLGAGMGIVYDLVRIIRRIIKHNNFFIGLEDIIFWIVWAFVVIDGIHIYNNGELRIYIFLGLFIGFLIYKNTIGWVIWKCISHILCWLKKRSPKGK